MKRLLAILLILTGCSLVQPVEVEPLCRHLAPFGALTWQNLTGEKTVIYMGPSKANPKIWHAQAAILDNDFVIRRWLVWDGKVWSTGQREAFYPRILYSPIEFYKDTINGKLGVLSRKQLNAILVYN